MALTVAGETAGADFSQLVQLCIEYAPAPPFDAGRSERAQTRIVASAQRRFDANRERRETAARRAAGSMAALTAK